jgi:serine/threonine-protein kinase
LPPPAVTRTEIAVPELLTLPANGPVFALSPDGARVVYVGNNGTQLFVRPLDSFDPPVPIVMGTRLHGPFVSPDGDWVGFFDGLTLEKVRITGGAPIKLVQIDATGSRGATWVTDDTIIMATDSVGTGLLAVPATAGGTATQLTRPDHKQGESQHLWPQRLPGGHAVLFTITSQTGGLAGAQIAVLDLRTRTWTSLLRGGSQAQYVASGHMVYAAGGTLRAVPFDVGRLKVRGADALVVPRLLTASTGGSDFAVAENGTLVYREASGGSAPSTLVWVDRMHNEEPIAAPPRAYMMPRLSLDGTRLALDIREQENEIWIWDFRSPGLRQLTIDPSTNRVPEWTRDGQRIVFTSNRGGADNLWWQAANGTCAAEPLITRSGVQLASGTTPDGDLVLFDRVPGKKAQLMLLALDGSRRLTPLLPTTSFERNGVVSPDGRWIAYESYRSDPSQSEIYVRPFPKTDAGYWKVSTGGGTRPLWARNGQELFYVGPPPNNTLMRVPVDASGISWHAGTPVKLLEGYAAISPSRTYDVAGDGRFIMIKPSAPDQTAAPSLKVVQHFDEELKRVAPPSGSR